MSHDETQNTDRRTFLQAGALATASALALAPGLQAQDAAARPTALPRRKLGKTGVEITMLEMGSGALRERSVLDRLLRLSFASGVRTFDTAKVYGTEPSFKKWFEQAPEVRKQIVLVTKDEPRTPERDAQDGRPAAGGPGDRLRRPLLHPRPRRPAQPRRRPSTSSRARSSRRRPRRSGSRARRSSSASRPTTSDRAQIIQAAAEGGIVDAIMLQYTPWLDKDSPLNKALDACHKKGIGLISMKQIAGQFPATAQGEHPRGGRQAGPDARREEAVALPGPAARDLDRRADQRLVRLDARTPTSSARTPTPPAATSR